MEIFILVLMFLSEFDGSITDVRYRSYPTLAGCNAAKVANESTYSRTAPVKIIAQKCVSQQLLLPNKF